MYSQDYFLLLGSFQQRDPLRVEEILKFDPLEPVSYTHMTLPTNREV